jgi:hypothetical protein
MGKTEEDELPLKVLVCDTEDGPAELLRTGVERSSQVLLAKRVASLTDARTELDSRGYNAVFIDPLSLNLEDAASFIFDVRRRLPEIVFVLYLERALAERDRARFYSGDRKRFAHYYSLDKGTPTSAFADELAATLMLCRDDLRRRLSAVSLERLRAEANELASRGAPVDRALLQAVDESLSRLARSTPTAVSREARTVFLSHRFAEEEYVKGLRTLLDQNGFQTMTGQSSNTYISRAIIERIRQADLFVCLMTRADPKADGTFTTSPWLLEEKGVALAFGKPLVIMVEEGVSDFGVLQGDWQRIHFGAKGFLSAALEAVAQLRSYAGRGTSATQPGR